MFGAINKFINLSMLTIATLLTAGCDGGYLENSDAADRGDVEIEDDDEFRYVLPIGVHGLTNNPKVKIGGVVDEHLVTSIPSNPQHTFWWFCGQSATATAINFARGEALTNASKVTQLQWFHERLLARQGNSYSVNDPAGPYAANVSWLYNLMLAEKSTEFAVSWLTTSDRELMKERMFAALDGGGFVVALNKTNSGVGHYLTVYAIDYQPGLASGGTVYYADVLYNNLGTVGFKTFLDRQLSQSNMALYNAFSVKKK